MRGIRADDYWRNLKKRRTQNIIESLSGNSIQNLPNGQILFPGAVTVVTGLNGVGKSTLLHAARLVLQRGSSNTIDNTALRNSHGGEIYALLKHDENTQSQVTIGQDTLTHTPLDSPVSVKWIDPSFEVPELIRYFREQKNLEEALVQVYPRTFKDDELSILMDLVGKRYEESSVFELENHAGRDICPYFRAKSYGYEYGIESMGFGEASLHYINWALTGLQQGTIILMEEPESYVSARSQEVIMDRLAQVCLETNSSAIVTTHSPHVFAKVPPSDTLILIRNAEGVQVIVKEDARTRLMALSVPELPTKSGILLVEDEVALHFATAWLRSFEPEMLNSWRIVALRGIDSIEKCLLNFPQQPGWFLALGLLDGDVRRSGRKKIDRTIFLPGDEPPEVLIKEAVDSNRLEISRILHIDGDLFAVAMSRLEGRDHHDWLRLLANDMNVSVERLVDAAFGVWAGIERNRKSCIESLSHIQNAVNGDPS